MRLVHHPDSGPSTILADRVRLADGPLSRARGLMGTTGLPHGEALVFRFRGVAPRRVHTLLVRGSIDVIWTTTETVRERRTMTPWSLGERNRADTVIELPAGAAEDVQIGDRLRIAPRRQD